MRCNISAGPFQPEERRCDWCGGDLGPRRRRWCKDVCSKNWYNNHIYGRARKATKRRDKYRCVKCGSRDTLEVNHIKPCRGKHTKHGCWHHMDNLETLCHDCHVKITQEQRNAGLFKKRRKR